MNPIIEELNARASFNWPDEQKAYYRKMAADAKAVECVRMRDVFTPEQLEFLFKICGYKAQKNMCYRNAAILVYSVDSMAKYFDPTVPEEKYVEGFGYLYWSFEHAFVKVGDKYIDPTFERALHVDVSKEIYASIIELDPETMAHYQMDTGYYGELYRYDYALRHRPELAARIRQLNPNNR